MERLLGKIEGQEPGPLVICIAALHGNEQVGIHAFRNVYSAIAQHNIRFRGKLIGLLGNIKAIEGNRRFIDYDMNRAWTSRKLRTIFAEDVGQRAENEEMRALYDIIERESKGDFSQLIMVDLHSTSADKGNFIVVDEDSARHPIVKALHIPTVVGLQDYLHGTLLDYYHQKGFLSFAFEGGMIGTDGVYQLHTSGLWEILDKSGCISHHDHEAEDHYARQLEAISEGLPKKVFVKHHKKVTPDEGFRMLPGFHNFQKVHRGQHLAINHEGNIYCPEDGLIFMPLYQPEGEDGFFIAEERSN